MRNVLTAALVLFAIPVFAQSLGDEKMKRANKAASTVVRERMAQERPADAAVLQNVESADIVVVSGQYDKVEDVLQTLGIKHTVVAPHQVGGLKLNAKQLLIVDCPGNLDAAGIERVRKFVNAGGYLYTTDWALLQVVQKAFPGFVEYNGKATQNDVVEVQVKESDSNLLKHLTLSKENPKWWLESSSYPIRILNKEKVDVLITSREMKTKYGDAPIAVHFRYGDGQVLHIASHFYLQQNQTRTVAETKKSAEYLKDDSALSATTKKALEGKVEFSGDVVAGDLNSAYAAQQMTSNIVVERKKDQTRIDSMYGKSIKAPQPTAPKGQGLDVGTRVKELERKGEQVKVRTMEGEERWVPASSL
jgi:hypothetical protein